MFWSDGVMTPTEVFVGVLVAATIAFALVLLTYWSGGRLAEKPKPTEWKYTMYACGEVLPPKKLQVNVARFYLFATFFLIFDVIAFVMAVSFGPFATGVEIPRLLPIVYLAVAFLAALFLVPREGVEL